MNNLPADYVLANFQSREAQEVRHDFSHSELIDLKHLLTDLAVQRSRKEGLLAEIGGILKKQTFDIVRLINEAVADVESVIDDRCINELNKVYAETLSKISCGYEIRKTMVYTLDFPEEGYLRFYDEAGNFLGERKIQGKHQLSIHSIKSAVNE